MSDTKLTKKDLIYFIESIEREDNYTLRQLFPERLGKKKWDNIHGSTQSFRKPGKNQLDGAKKSFEFLLRKFERMGFE